MVTTNISGLTVLDTGLEIVGQNIGYFWKISLKVITETHCKKVNQSQKK